MKEGRAFYMNKKPLTPRQIKALQTKQKILETALHLLSKKLLKSSDS